MTLALAMMPVKRINKNNALIFMLSPIIGNGATASQQPRFDQLNKRLRARPASPRMPDPKVSNVLGSGVDPRKVCGTPSVQPVWSVVGTYTRTAESAPGVKPANRAASGSGAGCPSLMNQASALIAEFAPPSATASV